MVTASLIRRRRGFTLLEVMIALAIAGIALVACLGLVNRSIYCAEQVRRISVATMLAQYKMTELEEQARRRAMAVGDSSGRWDEPYQQYRWQVEFHSTPIAGVSQVTVSVLWGDARRNEEVSLDSFLFN